jgi:hypothetical protein
MKQKRVLIVCGIFDMELERALEPLRDTYDVTTIRLKPGYHCLIEELEKKLEEAATSDLITDKSEARLFIGERCIPTMPDFAKKHNIKLLPEINCLAAMIGRQKLMELEQNKTMVITPAWIKRFFLSSDGIPSVVAWDATDFRINFGRYERILILETGEKLTDEEILEAFDLFGNPIIEFEPIDISYFNNLVKDFLA